MIFRTGLAFGPRALSGTFRDAECLTVVIGVETRNADGARTTTRRGYGVATPSAGVDITRLSRCAEHAFAKLGIARVLVGMAQQAAQAGYAR